MEVETGGRDSGEMGSVTRKKEKKSMTGISASHIPDLRDKAESKKKKNHI